MSHCTEPSRTKVSPPPGGIENPRGNPGTPGRFTVQCSPEPKRQRYACSFTSNSTSVSVIESTRGASKRRSSASREPPHGVVGVNARSQGVSGCNARRSHSQRPTSSNTRMSGPGALTPNVRARGESTKAQCA
jgi:hypothetical protein